MQSRQHSARRGRCVVDVGKRTHTPSARRRRNPLKYYLFIRWGRGWLRYDGTNFSALREGQGFNTKKQAEDYGEELRRQFPKELRRSEMHVDHQWPRKDPI
jgi:hypothetical protein